MMQQHWLIHPAHDTDIHVLFLYLSVRLQEHTNNTFFHNDCRKTRSECRSSYDDLVPKNVVVVLFLHTSIYIFTYL